MTISFKSITFFLLGFMVAMLLVRACSPGSTGDCDGSAGKSIFLDTTVVTVFDTLEIMAEKKEVKLPAGIPVRTLPDTSTSFSPCDDSTRHYQHHYEDSLVTISFETAVQGKLLKKDFAYRIHPVPVQVETITIRDVRLVHQPPKGLYATGAFSFHDYHLGVAWINDRWLFSLNFSPHSSTITAGAGVRIFK